jgi:hypothetical protein
MSICIRLIIAEEEDIVHVGRMPYGVMRPDGAAVTRPVVA